MHCVELKMHMYFLYDGPYSGTNHGWNFCYVVQIVGSSLLFVHDGKDAGVWMIDFGKTIPLQEGAKVTHEAPWVRGNHEDGYITGLENVIDILQEILSDSVSGAQQLQSL